MNDYPNIPVKTVRELLDSMHRLMSKEIKAQIRSTLASDVPLLWGLGQHIRNTYVHLNPNKDALLKGISPDDFSESIVKIFWEELQQEGGRI